MKIVAIVMMVYSGVMLLIHVSSWKLLAKWSRPGDSWIKRRFPPLLALRVEALYWFFCLASWHLWPSAAWKVMITVFAFVHLTIWIASELKILPPGALAGHARKTRQSIVTFDAFEAAALVAILWLAVVSLRYAG